MGHTRLERDEKSFLRGVRILLIEDDSDVLKRIRKGLEKNGCTIVMEKRCVHGEADGGLDELKTSHEMYDAVIVDVRLPTNEDLLRENLGLLDEWSPLQKRLRSIQEGAKPKNATEEENLHRRLADLTYQIRKNIDNDAGIQLIRSWVQHMKHLNGSDWKTPLPVLFLSARSEDGVQTAGQAAVGDGRFAWLPKPIRTGQLVRTLQSLLEK